jgi:hypothetical protein
MFLATGVPAPAEDHPLIGSRLVAKSRSGKQSFAWVSKAINAVFPSSSPAALGATLWASAADGDMQTVYLAPDQWSVSGSGLKARYVNSDAPGGPSVCRLVVLADRKVVKVSCRNDLIDTLDAGAEGSVDVVLTIGGDRYCASFGGVVTDETGKFIAADAPPPAVCPQTECPPTSTTTVPVCGGLESCSESLCPFPQACEDDGGGGCGCTGAPVPCGNVNTLGLCGLGECPPGTQCTIVSYPLPDCFAECACQ